MDSQSLHFNYCLASPLCYYIQPHFTRVCNVCQINAKLCGPLRAGWLVVAGLVTATSWLVSCVYTLLSSHVLGQQLSSSRLTGELGRYKGTPVSSSSTVCRHVSV